LLYPPSLTDDEEPRVCPVPEKESGVVEVEELEIEDLMRSQISEGKDLMSSSRGEKRVGRKRRDKQI